MCADCECPVRLLACVLYTTGTPRRRTVLLARCPSVWADCLVFLSISSHTIQHSFTHTNLRLARAARDSRAARDTVIVSSTMPTAPTVRVQAPLPNTGIVFERHKKGSWFQATFKAVFFGLVPLFVVYFAAFIAYVSTTPIPAGTFFWVVFQPSLWMATKTVEVGNMHISEGCSVLPAHTHHRHTQSLPYTPSSRRARALSHTREHAHAHAGPSKLFDLTATGTRKVSRVAWGLQDAHVGACVWYRVRTPLLVVPDV